MLRNAYGIPAPFTKKLILKKNDGHDCIQSILQRIKVSILLAHMFLISLD